MKKELNIRWIIVHHFSNICTKMNVLLLRKRPHDYTSKTLQTMPKNSLGNKLARTIEDEGLDFQSKLLRHDLKHIYLGYSMHVKDELRLHSYLIGNRNYNPLAMIYLFISTLFVLDYIPQLRQDFVLGKSNANIKELDLLSNIQADVFLLRKAHRLKLPIPLKNIHLSQ